ncbi:MAG: hypothetical protein H0T86_13780 [Gemmatimonadales bacterium]|nr:hypothetical protein [Gemmatimonadales bacterium]
MPISRPAVTSQGVTRPDRRFLLARRNLVLLAAAVLVLVAGYLTLAAGHASAAAVLLVLGYCVLFPIGIAL